MTRAWRQSLEDQSVGVPSMEVDAVRFVRPVEFAWFHEPRYRAKAGRRVA